MNYYGSSTCGARRAYLRLYGAFFTDNGTKVSLVAQRAGRPLARGKGTRASRTMLLKEWKNWCQSKPLEALRALLLCFRSFAEVGGSFLKDFSPHQFTVGKNEVFLIDGPDALSGPLYDVFAARNLPTVYDGPVRSAPPRISVRRRRRRTAAAAVLARRRAARRAPRARPRRRAAARPALVNAPRRRPTSSTWRRRSGPSPTS